MTDSLIDPATGEVDDAAMLAAANDYLLLADEIEHGQAELEAARKRLGALRVHLLAVMPQTIDLGDFVLVRTPPPRPPQRVSRSGCERWAEQLHALGLGEYRYQPPGIMEIRANAARILAAGIQLEAVAPTPEPGPDTLKIVPRVEG